MNLFFLTINFFKQFIKLTLKSLIKVFSLISNLEILLGSVFKFFSSSFFSSLELESVKFFFGLSTKEKTCEFESKKSLYLSPVLFPKIESKTKSGLSLNKISFFFSFILVFILKNF